MQHNHNREPARTHLLTAAGTTRLYVKRRVAWRTRVPAVAARLSEYRCFVPSAIDHHQTRSHASRAMWAEAAEAVSGRVLPITDKGASDHAAMRSSKPSGAAAEREA